MVRFVEDIAMHSFSRGIGTCVYRTSWCLKNCYANKFYAMGWAREEWDKVDDDWWQASGVGDIRQEIWDANKGQPPARFRFSIKGEIWTTEEDVLKVDDIITRMPDTIFWIPTRAWQDSAMQEIIEEVVLDRANARVMASLDPSTADAYTINYLRERGWSILYVGHNEDQEQQLLTETGDTEENLTEGMFRCPKTWEGKLGHCAICTEGCFSEKRVDVQLRKHK